MEAAATRLSQVGEHGALWLVVAAAGALLGGRPRRRHCRRALLTIALTYVVNTVVKVLIRRARPLLEDLPRLSATMSNRSYPSAHASTSFAAARALSPTLPSEPLYLGATAMALSRPYLGVHYPSDIAAGAVLGVVLGGAGRAR